MIERKFVKQNIMEHGIKQFVRNQLSRAGLSDVKFMRTPLGEKIVVYASRPGLVVGRGGGNIAQMTRDLKKHFGLENPQIEIEEVHNANLDPNIIAEMIVNTLERFGPARFKGTGYKALQDVMNAGARGVEIIISGKIPSARAKNWRFYAGYLKKCGDTALTGVDSAYSVAKIKAGSVGVKVSIMPPTTKLPDDIEIYEEIGMEEVGDEVTEEKPKKRSKKKEEGIEKKEDAEVSKKEIKEKKEEVEKAEEISAKEEKKKTDTPKEKKREEIKKKPLAKEDAAEEKKEDAKAEKSDNALKTKEAVEK